MSDTSEVIYEERNQDKNEDAVEQEISISIEDQDRESIRQLIEGM